VFHTDVVHNVVHLVSGLLFLIFAFASPANAPAFMKVFGIVYFILGVLGLMTFGTTGEGKLLGFLHVNGPDQFLHIGLGIIIFLAGTVRNKAEVAT
jgi:hypothetical protein